MSAEVKIQIQKSSPANMRAFTPALTLLLLGDQRYINQFSYDMIPGLQLIDKNFLLVCDATGHHPKSSLFGELIPSVSKLLK